MQPPESTAMSLDDINRRLNSMASSLQAMESVVQNMVDHIMQQGGIKGSGDISKVLKEELRNLNSKMEDMDVSQSFVAFSVPPAFFFGTQIAVSRCFQGLRANGFLHDPFLPTTQKIDASVIPTSHDPEPPGELDLMGVVRGVFDPGPGRCPVCVHLVQKAH